LISLDYAFVSISIYRDVPLCEDEELGVRFETKGLTLVEELADCGILDAGIWREFVLPKKEPILLLT
jgi:hypothetical protein